EAARRQAERDAERERAPARPGAPPRRAPAQVARTAPIQVGGLGWPVSGALLAGYGARMPDGRPSSGVLIGAAAGTPVKAVAEGTVVFAEWMTGYGNIVIVDHGNGHMSLYAHNDAVLRQVGDRVQRGDTLASVGNSGGQGQPALYFELRRDGKPVDPSTWLQRR
ncbi:peptidoglycan DD-metalloendopeptidase family protein, partial [Luteimonas sp. Y-2-2-4F]